MRLCSRPAAAEQTRAVPSLENQSLYFSRELSGRLQRRISGLDARTPCWKDIRRDLPGNLDEFFFMIRVAPSNPDRGPGLRRSDDGRTPADT